MTRKINFLLLIFFLLLCTACGQNKNIDNTNLSSDSELTINEQKTLVTLKHSVDSPSGNFKSSMRKIADNELTRLEIVVLDKKTNKEIVIEDQLRMRDSNFVLWDKSDRLWIYNGDTGVLIWTYSNGIWNEKTLKEAKDTEDDFSIPKLLIKLRPRLSKE